MIGVALVVATMAAYALAQKAIAQAADLLFAPRFRMSMLQLRRSFMWAKWKYDQAPESAMPNGCAHTRAAFLPVGT